jgi:hypothetical protein
MAMWTQADIDSLKAAIALGALSVRYSGPPERQVTYHSLDEMRALLSSMQHDVDAGAGKSRGKRLASSKGFTYDE